ncbi:hypothetical protein AcW1_005942 [Taiwanofungus camphoratus]|nr:hypothetical protein AcV5_006258 [Antrodia cinnamomea]KAI0957606.1 hypothetical protein AcW1_005942 [Antrodia cinnamomea]
MAHRVQSSATPSRCQHQSQCTAQIVLEFALKHGPFDFEVPDQVLDSNSSLGLDLAPGRPLIRKNQGSFRCYSNYNQICSTI